MPGVVRMHDVDSAGHPCSSASSDTYLNQQMVARTNDTRPCPKSGGKNIGTNHTVIVNNEFIQTCGDPVSSGHSQSQCSPNLFADG